MEKHIFNTNLKLTFDHAEIRSTAQSAVCRVGSLLELSSASSKVLSMISLWSYLLYHPFPFQFRIRRRECCSLFEQINRVKSRPWRRSREWRPSCRMTRRSPSLSHLRQTLNSGGEYSPLIGQYTLNTRLSLVNI